MILLLNFWNCSNSVIFFVFHFIRGCEKTILMIYRLLLLTAELKLYLFIKKRLVRSSSVIIMVKMKYNRLDIKWWLASTSFKIFLDIISYLYITFTIFYYNSISLKCTFFPVLVKGLYQTESYSLHVMQLIRI